MATLDTNIPDTQIANLATYLDSDAEEDAERLEVITIWLQGILNNFLWEMARRNAIDGIEDPTV